ncbi:unnamed protein product [Durusdinium trenchii]|uniref:Uncharacterized protein n=2 Tax=Durusdinium trenchii TaxID=1381693 RepID=A0ABP0QXJ3_9DINO
MLLAQFLVACCILQCWYVGEARRMVSSHFHSARTALESSRKVLIAIRREISDDEDGNDIVNYLSGKLLDQCQKLKAEELPHQANASMIGNLKEKLKLSDLCEQHGDKLLTKLSKNLHDPKTSEWICSQGFELSKIKIDGNFCRETSELLLRGLQDTLQEKDTQRQVAKLGIYLVRAAVIVAPLPGPIGWILDKATQMLLKKLTKDAEEALDNLEKKLEMKMWDISRQVVAEEFLRVGGEQVKVAEDQVKDIETIDEDDFWGNLMKDSQDPALQKVVAAAKEATSFNRWAAIEQSLATTLAILRPPDFMETAEEMEPFIKVMKIHFQIELTVLSHMFKVVENGASFQKMVVSKAHRAALAVLPYFFIIGSDEALLETMKSPLLTVKDHDPCEEGGHSLVCVWLRLLSSSKQKAKAFESPWSLCAMEPVPKSKYHKQIKTFGFGTFESEGFGVFVHFVNNTEKLLNFKCGGADQYIAQWREVHDESKYFGKDTIEGKCVTPPEGLHVKRHLKFTSTSTFCATMLTYGNVSVGELVSAKFEEEPVETSRCNRDHTWHFSRTMTSSTCYISNIYMT